MSDVFIDIFFMDGRILPNMSANLKRRTRSAKLTFFERLDVFDLPAGAMLDCIK
jgi:hypothetical protein